MCDAGFAVGGRHIGFVPGAFVWPFSGEGGSSLNSVTLFTR